MKIDIIAGARPNFVKVAPLIHAMHKQAMEVRLVHTGQHYDRLMSQSFFDDLGIPTPDVNLNCGSGTQAEQTGAIMVAYERLLNLESSDICVVVGDVNSTLACAIVAKKHGLKVCHVEAGIRSGDLMMPEEINRIVTDSITDVFYTTTQHASQNLLSSGVNQSSVCFVGNTMIDTLTAQWDRLKAPDFYRSEGLVPKDYFVLTMHRPSNVDDISKFNSTLEKIVNLVDGKKVIFPVHPRVKGQINDTLASQLLITEPLAYLEFNYLVRDALAVITDSGGITEECTVMGVPCMTLRETTERPETVELGTNILVGENPDNLKPCIVEVLAGQWKEHQIPPLWDGRTSERIVSDLLGRFF